MDRKIAPEVVISMPPDECSKAISEETKQQQQQESSARSSAVDAHWLSKLGREGGRKRAMHSLKFGLAMVFVSLLFMLDVVHDRLGDNAMWAVMTVVVVFELTAGGTISKGVNRGVGTMLGGVLGSMVALLAQEIGGAGKAVTIGSSLFFFGAAATYSRMNPNIKKKYDYGALIFILTFSLISVSGVRGDQIIILARDRLSSIAIGFVICIFVTLFVFPVWAGDELHNSLASKFLKLAESIEGCLEDNVKLLEGKNGAASTRHHSNCVSVLCSKSSDEVLANFAKWEPWHGRFGFSYPWKKYLRIGDLLRDLAASVLSLRECLQSNQQACLMVAVRERCEATCMLLGSTLRELGNSIHCMKRFQQRDTVLMKLQEVKQDLCSSTTIICTLGFLMNKSGAMEGGVASITSIVNLLVGILDKVEMLVKETQELEKVAVFSLE